MPKSVVKFVSLSHNIYNEIDYIGDDSSTAHNIKNLPKNERNIWLNKHRNIATTDIDCRTCGVKYTVADFRKLNAKKPGNKVKTVNWVVSPEKGTINPNNRNQVNAFLHFCKKLTRKAFPHHMAYLAVQRDNQRQIPHCHIMVSALSEQAPYKTMPGWEYGENRFRKLYDQEAILFNHQQNDIKLGLSVARRGNEPSHEDKLSRKMNSDIQLVINQLDKGESKNKTQLKKAFKQHGIIVKFHDFRHRKRDSKGNYVYRRYQTGKHRGQYMWRKSKHGRRHKVPLYNHTYGITLHYNKKHRRHHKVKYIKASTLQDNRVNYRYIMHQLNHSAELRREYKRGNRTKWLINQSRQREGPSLLHNSNSSNTSTNNSSNVSNNSATSLSNAYSNQYSSAVNAISSAGINLKSLNPQPIPSFSFSYNPEVELALASVADSASSADDPDLDSISSMENTFGPATGAVASGATAELSHPEDAVGYFMPKMSSNNARQGAYVKLNEIYPEYLVDNHNNSNAKKMNRMNSELTNMKRVDNRRLDKVFQHIEQNVKSNFIRTSELLKRKAYSAKKWLNKHGLGKMKNGHNLNFDNLITFNQTELGKNNKLNIGFKVASIAENLDNKFKIKFGLMKRHHIKRTNPKQYRNIEDNFTNKLNQTTAPDEKHIMQEFNPDLASYAMNKNYKRESSERKSEYSEANKNSISNSMAIRSSANSLRYYARNIFNSLSKLNSNPNFDSSGIGRE